VKERSTGLLGESSLESSKEPVKTQLALYCFRLEKAIATLKPAEIWADPTTSFWTAYKKVADEFDTDLASKYAGDLSTSLVFVSASTSLAYRFAWTKFFLHVRRVYSRQLLPRSLSKSFQGSSQTPPT